MNFVYHLFYRFLRWCPGALGLLLRQKIYPRLLGSCGRGVLFGRFVDLGQPQRISLGDRVIISNYVVLDASCYEGNDIHAIVIEADVFLGTATHLRARKNKIALRSGTNIGSSCKIEDHFPVTIGPNVLLAAYCTIGEAMDNEAGHEQKKQSDSTHRVETVVEHGCWLGVRVLLKSGARVCKESIVGAHAVVEGEIPSWAIAAGQPARVLKFRN